MARRGGRDPAAEHLDRVAVVRTRRSSKAARLLDIVGRSPGVSLDRLVEVTGYPRSLVASELGRFRRAGQVSSDEIDGRLCYWLERRTEPTVSDRVWARLLQGPAEWRELASASNDALSNIMRDLEDRGLVRVEERTRIGYTGRTVCAPSLYHAVVDVDCQQAAK